MTPIHFTVHPPTDAELCHFCGDPFNSEVSIGHLREPLEGPHHLFHQVCFYVGTILTNPSCCLGCSSPITNAQQLFASPPGCTPEELAFFFNDPDLTDQFRDNVLLQAISSQNQTLVEILFQDEDRLSVEIVSEAIELAASGESNNLLKFLLDRWQISASQVTSALICSVEFKQPRNVKTLLDLEITIDAGELNHIFMRAVETRQLETTRLLLNTKKISRIQQQISLRVAAVKRHNPLIKLLLKNLASR